MEYVWEMSEMMSEMSERHACRKQHDENYSKDREVKGKRTRKDTQWHSIEQNRLQDNTAQYKGHFTMTIQETIQKDIIILNMNAERSKNGQT